MPSHGSQQQHRDLSTGHHRPAALFLDAAGTFLIPSEPVADVYLRYGAPRGVTLDARQVLQRFRSAYNDPWINPNRYNGDARDFWRQIVHKSLDTRDEAVFEDIYQYYERSEAWTLPPGFEAAVRRVRAAGIQVCVVSNFDSRLRPLLAEMGLQGAFDHVVVSAEVGAEKPNPRIFREACRLSGVDPDEDVVVHVGDDRRNDVTGARQCGIHAWLWGVDVDSFEEVADRCVTGDIFL